jgi:hypothetical protein
MSTAASDPGPDTPPASWHSRAPIDAGASVEVRSRFDGRWCVGFEVADRIEADSSSVTYRLRRISDGAVLPVLFSDDDVIVARGQTGGVT